MKVKLMIYNLFLYLLNMREKRLRRIIYRSHRIISVTKYSKLILLNKINKSNILHCQEIIQMIEAKM